ncbi:SpoIIE family protein phosphatase [Massilia niastensis]|uniref:SpoIIE family protein phosphatase n=1 Tax=Massilia niastensis TaxID=544911 RepID=UPI0003749FB8|nr:SpoIIE family protein phosphatase [Massilia niastensis]
MGVQSISSGADSGRNEDLVAVFETGNRTDLLVIDGASSVADRDYIDEQRGDVVWFVHAFASALAATLDSQRTQHDSVRLALAALQEEWAACLGGQTMPVHAWPIAALSWVRIVRHGDAQRAELYSLGDCKTLLRAANGLTTDIDPYVNPQESVLQAEIEKLQARGVTDAMTRRAHLLPMLRTRREFQNTTLAPFVLCLRPHGPLDARTARFDLAPGTALLMMTDGFYRLVDTYGLYGVDELADACVRLGPARLLAQLRAHEAAHLGAAALAVKRADDASAVVWTAACRMLQGAEIFPQAIGSAVDDPSSGSANANANANANAASVRALEPEQRAPG